MATYVHYAKRFRCRDSVAEIAERVILEQARDILMRRLGARNGAALLQTPSMVRDYLRISLATLEAEEFWVIWMDQRNRVIAGEQMFVGTLSQTSVYPREVVKAALRHNAAACIFAHNHPSGTAEPSCADELLTSTLKQALALVDVRVLDHIIIAGGYTMSFAERGLL